MRASALAASGGAAWHWRVLDNTLGLLAAARLPLPVGAGKHAVQVGWWLPIATLPMGAVLRPQHGTGRVQLQLPS